MPIKSKQAKSNLAGKAAKRTAPKKTNSKATRKSASGAASKRRAVAQRGSNGKIVPFHGGRYTTPGGNVTLGLPAFWTLRQTNDDLELDSPSGATSVIVTAFHREPGFSRLDAREYLGQYLQTAAAKGRKQIEQNGRSRARSRYRDTDGDYWQVEFLTDGDTLLLATMNSSLPPRSPEPRTGGQVLGTIRLK